MVCGAYSVWGLWCVVSVCFDIYNSFQISAACLSPPLLPRVPSTDGMGTYLCMTVLQLGDKAVTTKNLTRAFGWNSRDAFLQQDVQVPPFPALSYPSILSLHTLAPTTLRPTLCLRAVSSLARNYVGDDARAVGQVGGEDEGHPGGRDSVSTLRGTSAQFHKMRSRQFRKCQAGGLLRSAGLRLWGIRLKR